MKKFKIHKVLLLILVLIFVVACSSNESKNKYNDVENVFSNDKDYLLKIDDIHATIEILDEGYDIYTCNGYGYRYGPSIMYYDDGSLDLWIASPGNNSTEWDYIRYMHSDDGVNWSDEKVVLRPTKYSLDHYSTCDPGVIYFNGYYYLGYTSTTDSSGNDNDIFVARSENPDGPFEKWNGEGWGGDPVPFIEFEGTSDNWGVGEISFCIKDETLYCYYSYYGIEGSLTKVAIADLSENWPASIELMGTAFNKENGEDSCDVVYVPEYDRFLALSIGHRLTDESNITVHESMDGLTFNKVDNIDENINAYCHSIGISKKTDGSINPDDDLYIGYAYGDMGWGKWSACIHSVKLDTYIDKE